MDYKKPSKARANEAYLRNSSFSKSKAPYYEEQIVQKKLFLIICEGENTEPCYFNSFPVPSKTVITDGGRGTKTALVDYAIEISKQKKYAGREIWCVFDMDKKPDEAATQPQDFNTAILKAKQNGLKAAWSNDAFELWFVLHYQELDTCVTRKEYNKILKQKWNLKSFSKEAKTNEFCEGHYARHGGTNSEMQQLAIKRAKSLHSMYKGQDYANQCPSTNVYELVVVLNQNLKA